MKNRTQKIVLGIIKTLGIIVNHEFMINRPVFLSVCNGFGKKR